MITINLIELLTGLNTLILIGICVVYFKKNYTIVSKSAWDAAVEVCEAYNEEHQEVEELAGGTGIAVGFGADYLEDDNEEEEEE